MRQIRSSTFVGTLAGKKLSRRGRLALAGVLAMPGLVGSAQAADQYWDLNGATAGATDDAGGVATGVWDDATANWSTTSVGTISTAAWVAGNTPVFSAGTNATGASNITVVGGKNVAGMTFQEGTITLSGDGITLTSASITVNNGGTTIGNNLTGSTTFTKNGTSALTLSGANALTGATTVNGGELNLDYRTNNNNKINPAGVLTIGSTASVNIIGFDGVGTDTSQSVGSLTLGTASSTNITVTKGDTQNATLALGAITRNGTALVNFSTAGVGAGTAAITTTSNTLTNGIVGGHATYNKSSWATISGGNTLAPFAAYDVDDFSGPTKNTDVSGSLAAPADFSINTLRINTPATVTLSGNNTIAAGGGILIGTGVGAGPAAITGGSLSAAGELAFHQHNTASDFTLGSALTGSTALNKGGAGALVLTGANTNTGTFTVSGGRLKIGAADVLPDAATVFLGAGGVLDVNGQNDTIGTISGTGTVDLNGGNLSVGANGASYTFGGIVAGSGRLIKTGTGTLTLSGINTFTQGFTVAGGTVALAANEATGVAGGTTGNTGTVPGAFVPDFITLMNGGVLKSLNTGSAGTFMATNKGITLGAGGGVLHTVSPLIIHQAGAIIAGSGSLTKQGSGVLALVTAATYTGGTFIEEGTIRLRTNSNLMPNGGTFSISAGAAFDMANLTDTIGALTGAGNVLSTATTTGTLTVSSTTTHTFSGSITSTAGAATNTGLKLTKSGTGTLVLSGSNFNTGAITVGAGVIQFNSTASIGGTGATITANANSAAAAGYAIDQAFLGRIVNTSVGSASLAADSANDLDFTGFSTLSLGASNGTWTYSGTLTPDGTTYRLGGGRGTLAFAPLLTGGRDLAVSNTGTVQLINSGNDYTGATSIGSGAVLSIGNGGTTGAIPAATVVTNNGNLTVNRSDNLTLPNQIDGTGTFTKSGAGTLALSGNNSFTGNVTVNGGSLVVDNLSDLGTGTKTLTLSGAQLHLDGAAGDLSLPSTWSVTSSGVTLFNDAGNNTVAGNITMASGFGDTTITSNGGSLTLAGEIFPNTTNRNLRLDGTATGTVGVIRDGSATNKVISVIKQGAGTWTINAAGTHTGATTVNAGTLKLGVDAAIPATSATTVNGGTLDLNGHSQTIPSLAGTGGSVLVSGALTVGGTASTSFAGSLVGTSSLTKVGSGTQSVGSLDVATVAVNEGTLAVAPGSTMARVGTLTVAAGARMDLTNNRAVFTATSADTLRGLLLTARAADVNGIGQWTGSGLTSSTAAADVNKVTGIGYLTAAEKGLTGGSWGGATNLAATDVLVSVGPIGDLDLSGTLNRDDVALFDLGLALYTSGAITAGQATHLRGDVTYDGIVDVNDALQVDRSLAAHGLASPELLAAHEAMFGAGYASQVLASVPEPTSLMAAFGLALPLVARRRNRR